MNTQQLEIVGTERKEIQAPTPMAMIQLAIQQNADIDKLAKLMDLQERWEANEARKAFVFAMNKFKENPPEIRKNKHVAFGQTEYDHATLDHVTDAIAQRLSAYGFSHRWDVEQKDAKIKVTCVLTHEAGHSERVALEAPADNSGSKNAIQAIGSAVTYLQRYTLLSATGLAAKNGDNDGAGSPKYEDLNERLEWIANCRTTDELLKVFKQAYKEANDAKDMQAMKTLVAAKDARKVELR
jgi:hypothetical protein